MAKSKSEIVISVLNFLFEAAQLLPRPLEAPYAHARRLRKLAYKDYYDAMYRLHKRGIVQISKQNGKNFIALTEKGMLEMLLEKAAIQKQDVWDGKWRIIIFDIPEDAHLERDRLRWLLKQNGFQKLQASVFVNPYPLNREAIQYLNQTGLNKYLRILRVDEMDNDADLRKKFNLK